MTKQSGLCNTVNGCEMNQQCTSKQRWTRNVKLSSEENVGLSQEVCDTVTEEKPTAVRQQAVTSDIDKGTKNKRTVTQQPSDTSEERAPSDDRTA